MPDEKIAELSKYVLAIKEELSVKLGYRLT